MNFSDQIRSRLSTLTPRRREAVFSGEAAVLVAIMVTDRRPHFVLTRRTEKVATHKGQISFPGGLREVADGSLEITALRETREEIGVKPNAVEILGEFHDYQAVTGQLVRPFVGIIAPGTEFVPQSFEVEYVLQVPFSFFINSEPTVRQRERDGKIHRVYYYDFNGESIWGLTARIIKDFLDYLDDQQPALDDC
jgi:8-oxo-dGTP pyrophosphatase MutT (NUDIX family)